MPSQTSFDFVIGEFSEGKLSGKAKYYDSEDLFMKDFATAFKKLTELGC